jgi:hypothetical protein
LFVGRSDIEMVLRLHCRPRLRPSGGMRLRAGATWLACWRGGRAVPPDSPARVRRVPPGGSVSPSLITLLDPGAQAPRAMKPGCESEHVHGARCAAPSVVGVAHIRHSSTPRSGASPETSVLAESWKPLTCRAAPIRSRRSSIRSSAALRRAVPSLARRMSIRRRACSRLVIGIGSRVGLSQGRDLALNGVPPRGRQIRARGPAAPAAPRSPARRSTRRRGTRRSCAAATRSAAGSLRSCGRPRRRRGR